MHLTIDPITTVPFVVTNCALCHTERLRWPGGEAIIVGLGNKRVRIHAYDAAFAAITTQPGFTAAKLGRLAREAAREHEIPWPDEYADALVGATLAALRTRAADRAELHARTAGGSAGPRRDDRGVRPSRSRSCRASPSRTRATSAGRRSPT